jgi:hypothetical protein
MEGRCQCGSVTFRTPQAEPLQWYVCHCLECRRQSASAFGISAIFPNFDLIAQNASASTNTASKDENENELIGNYTHSNTTSGRSKRCYFCKNCGTRIMNLSIVPGNEKGGFVAVKGGCLEGINGDVWTSATHIWTKSALLVIPEGVERFEGEPPPRA